MDSIRQRNVDGAKAANKDPREWVVWLDEVIGDGSDDWDPIFTMTAIIHEPSRAS
jgi:hypothetical protein